VLAELRNGEASSTIGVGRMMYGSDDIPVGIMRGKYVSFGRAWSFLSESNHSLALSHCDGRMTFTRYEQLRAMRRAAMRACLTSRQIDELFYFTALQLVEAARESLQAQAVPPPHIKMTVVPTVR
jgi:hypothetical protein